MFIIVPVLKILHFVTFAFLVSSFLLWFASLRIIFSKRKTGKKKADYQGGQEEKPKGNGIIGGYL